MAGAALLMMLNDSGAVSATRPARSETRSFSVAVPGTALLGMAIVIAPPFTDSGHFGLETTSFGCAERMARTSRMPLALAALNCAETAVFCATSPPAAGVVDVTEIDGTSAGVTAVALGATATAAL